MGDVGRASHDGAWTREHRALVALTRRAFEATDEQRPASPSELDWTEVLRLAVAHKVGATVLHAVDELGWAHHLPATAEPFRAAVATAQARARALLTEIAPILAGTGAAGVDVRLLRGPAIAPLYRHPSARTFVDIDLVCDPDQVDVLTALLHEHGWRQGNLDRATGEIVALTAEELRRSDGEKSLPAFLKVDASSGLLLVVEPHLRLFAHHQPFSLSARQVLEAPDDGALARRSGLPAVSAEAFLIETCIHAYNHCTALHAVRAGADLQLYRATDIAVLVAALGAELSWSRVADLVDGWGVAGPVELGLELARRIYGLDLPVVGERGAGQHDLWYFGSDGGYAPVLHCADPPSVRIFTRSHDAEVARWQPAALLDETRVRDPHLGTA